MQTANQPDKVPSSGDKWAAHPSIVHLDDENFSKELKKNKFILVMFYAPCK